MNQNTPDIPVGAQSILKTINIPTQPQAVMELMNLINDQDVDIKQVAEIVKKDPSLTGKVLKIANSPLFGLRCPVDSISNAISVMGFHTFKQVVLTSALRDVFKQKPSPLCEMFWSHSEMTARCCEILARKLRPSLARSAYLAGLFHDCAIPVLQKRFPDYGRLIFKGMYYQTNILTTEDQLYSTNHCTIGYLFTRSWHLPEVVRYAILRHHDGEPPTSNEYEARTLTAI
jgi:HD-like signal output (HDOD) protein